MLFPQVQQKLESAGDVAKNISLKSINFPFKENEEIPVGRELTLSGEFAGNPNTGAVIVMYCIADSKNREACDSSKLSKDDFLKSGYSIVNNVVLKTFTKPDDKKVYTWIATIRPLLEDETLFVAVYQYPNALPDKFEDLWNGTTPEIKDKAVANISPAFLGFDAGVAYITEVDEIQPYAGISLYGMKTYTPENWESKLGYYNFLRNTSFSIGMSFDFEDMPLEDEEIKNIYYAGFGYRFNPYGRIILGSTFIDKVESEGDSKVDNEFFAALSLDPQVLSKLVEHINGTKTQFNPGQ